MSQNKPKKENFWLSLFLNIVIPALILLKAEKWLAAAGIAAEDSVAPAWYFCAALAFPVCYGIWDLAARKKWSMFAVLGVVNVLLTGTIGLFELPREWIIAKEAGIPALLGLFVLVSACTSKPLARVLVYNDVILDTKRIDAAISARGEGNSFRKSMRTATLMIAASFFLSGAIQYFLAGAIYTEGASQKEFNEQVGQMTWIAYVVVMVPCMAIMFAAMFKIFRDLKRMTGLDFEGLLAEDVREKGQKA